jgi:hypothetical protein
MKHTTEVPPIETEEMRDRRTREELAEAERHRARESEHRREATRDRNEGAVDRAEGRRVEAVRNEVEAAGHEVAARAHDRAAEHDQREALAESRTDRAVAATGDARRSATSDGRDTPRAPAPAGAGGAPGTRGSASMTRAADMPGAGQGGGPLLGDEHCRRFRSRWETVQASFIDEPRQAVADADALVREATQELHAVFERDRHQLEGIWDRGDQVSTEDLRITLQRYRSFFERLLSI